jgi:hypothetical protein
MKTIYTQFTDCTSVSEANKLLDKYLFQVNGNQRSKLYQIHRHTVKRIENQK